jgi:hypothetical protein
VLWFGVNIQKHICRIKVSFCCRQKLTRVCVCEYKHSYCTHFNMAKIEDIINVLKVDVHTLWKFHSEKFKLEKCSLEAHLLLLQLNILHRFLSV